MTIATKIIASTLIATGISLAGYYLIGVGDGEVEWNSLTEDNDFATTYAGKVGEKYGMYLTGVTNTANEAWWNKIYQTYKAEVDKNEGGPKPLSSHFAKERVTSAYSDSSANALNKVCEKAYKKNLTSDVDFSSATNTEDKDKLASDILRYCSPLVEKPTTMQESDSNAYTGENVIGKKGHAKKLVKVTENDKFWALQNEWFKKQGSTTLDDYFARFFKVEDSSKVFKGDQTIKQICEEAYTKEEVDSATAEKPKVDDVTKYCAFIKSNP